MADGGIGATLHISAGYSIIRNTSGSIWKVDASVSCVHASYASAGETWDTLWTLSGDYTVISSST